MPRLGKVLQHQRNGADETVQVDTGGGAIQTAEHVAPSGDDSPPLPGDYAALSEGTGKGGLQVTGYHDPKTTREASPGEKRLYARDADGNVVGSVWLKGDGTIVSHNVAGTLELAPTGVISLTSAKCGSRTQPGDRWREWETWSRLCCRRCSATWGLLSFQRPPQFRGQTERSRPPARSSAGTTRSRAEPRWPSNGWALFPSLLRT